MNFPKNIFEKKIVAAEIWSRSFLNSQNYRLQGTLPPEYDKNGLLVSETVSVATFGSRNQWNASKINRELKKQNPREGVRSPFFGQNFSKIFIFLWTGRNSSFFSPFWSPRKRFPICKFCEFFAQNCVFKNSVPIKISNEKKNFMSDG